MSDRQFYYCILLEEHHPDDAYLATCWSTGKHPGEAIDRALTWAHAKGYQQPLCRAATLTDPEDIEEVLENEEAERDPDHDIVYHQKTHHFPFEDAFWFPYGIIPT